MTSTPSILNAASVGAKTVYSLDSLAKVVSNPVACNASTRMVKPPFATAVSTMLAVGISGAVGTANTASST